MDEKELLSGLEALLERAKLAERKIQYSSQLERLERRVKQLEDRLDEIQRFLSISFSKENNR